MSLINDALKRARDAQRNDPPSGASPLPPVEPPPRGGIGWILAAAVVLLLAAAGVFFGPSHFRHEASPATATKTPEAPAPPPAKAPPARVIQPPPATNSNPTISPPSASAAKQWPKVQGIIFNAARPLAIVNGQTVGDGDRVGDVQVKQILKDSVIFQQPDGSQKTLGIGE